MTSINSKRSKRLKTPKNKFDEDCQLAIALSASESEDNRFRVNTNVNEVELSTNDIMNVYDIKHETCRGNKEYAVLPTPTNKGHDVVCRQRKRSPAAVMPLLMVDQEPLKQKLADKISKLLVLVTDEDEAGQDELIDRWQSKLILSRLAEKCSTRITTAFTVSKNTLWNMTTLQRTDGALFYVSSLMPPIVRVSDTHYQNSLASRFEIHSNLNVDVCHDKTSLIVDRGQSEANFYASTQSVVVLAELAMDESNNDDDDDDDAIHSLSQTSADNKHGFHGSMIDSFQSVDAGFCPLLSSVSTDAAQDLLDSLENMVNNPLLSDVTIQVKDGVLSAHKFILASRCHRLLSMLETRHGKDFINLASYTKMATLCILRYLYCARCDFPESVRAEAWSLARRLGVAVFCKSYNEIVLPAKDSVAESLNPIPVDLIEHSTSESTHMLSEIKEQDVLYASENSNASDRNCCESEVKAFEVIAKPMDLLGVRNSSIVSNCCNTGINCQTISTPLGVGKCCAEYQAENINEISSMGMLNKCSGHLSKMQGQAKCRYNVFEDNISIVSIDSTHLTRVVSAGTSDKNNRSYVGDHDVVSPVSFSPTKSKISCCEIADSCNERLHIAIDDSNLTNSKMMLNQAASLNQLSPIQIDDIDNSHSTTDEYCETFSNVLKRSNVLRNNSSEDLFIEETSHSHISVDQKRTNDISAVLQLNSSQSSSPDNENIQDLSEFAGNGIDLRNSSAERVFLPLLFQGKPCFSTIAQHVSHSNLSSGEMQDTDVRDTNVDPISTTTVDGMATRKRKYSICTLRKPRGRDSDELDGSDFENMNSVFQEHVSYGRPTSPHIYAENLDKPATIAVTACNFLEHKDALERICTEDMNHAHSYNARQSLTATNCTQSQEVVICGSSDTVYLSEDEASHKTETEDSFTMNDDCTFDPPTDLDADTSHYSLLCEDVLDDSLQTNFSSNYKPVSLPNDHSSKLARQSNNLVEAQTSNDPKTPATSYRLMMTPDLRKRCKQIGVRMLSKKKMIKILENINTETSQNFTTASQDVTVKKLRTSKGTKLKRAVPSRSKITKEVGNGAREGRVMSTTKSQDQCYVSSSSSTSNSIERKRKELLDYITNNKKLHLQILHYEPIELEKFRSQLKESGIKMSPNLLIDILDEQSILFTTRSSQTDSCNFEDLLEKDENTTAEDEKTPEENCSALELS